MGTVSIEQLPDLHVTKSRDLTLEIAELLQPHRSGGTKNTGASCETMDLINNSLQALVNMFYLIARESRLEPQLQPMVTQIQAELAQLSRGIQKLGGDECFGVALKKERSSEMKSATILITEDDLLQLERLVESARKFQPLDHDHLARLEEELGRAMVVAGNDIPRDLVTMNSEVRVKDLDSGKVSTYKIVFPRDALVAGNRISVLAPIGTALLGYRAGDTIEWKMPAGRRRLKIEAVLYQPEAAQRSVHVRKSACNQQLYGKRSGDYSGWQS